MHNINETSKYLEMGVSAMIKNRVAGYVPKNKNGIRLLHKFKSLPKLEGERLDVFIKTNGYCFYCGIKLKTYGISNDDYFTVDHVLPTSKGGADVLENKVPSCRECNHIKRDLLYTDKIIEKLEGTVMEFNILIKDEKSGSNHPNTKISKAISIIMDAMADGKEITITPSSQNLINSVCKCHD